MSILDIEGPLESYNQNFRHQRIKSENSLLNLCDLFTVLLAILLLYLILRVFKKLLRDESCLGRATQKLLSQFSQDNIALFCQISFIAVSLHSLLNIYGRPRKDTVDDIAYGFSFVFLLLCACYLGFFFYFIHKHFKRLEEPEFKKKFLGLYDGLNTKTKF